MLKATAIIVAAFVTIGCTGQVTYSGLLAEEESLVESSSTLNVDLPEKAASVATVSTDTEATSSQTVAQSPQVLSGTDLFSFGAGEPQWYTVNDTVMGGVSNSNVSVTETGDLAFSGIMSLENNGGFASVRSDWQTFDLSDSDGILFRVFGDGKSYRLRIRTATTDRRVSYNALFDTVPNEWQLVYIPFKEMVPTSFGYVVDVGPLDNANIGSFGYMLSDKQPGEFELIVDWMRAISEEEKLTIAK